MTYTVSSGTLNSSIPYHTIPYPSVLWSCWLGDRKGIRLVKRWLLVCWWWQFDWSVAHLTVPFVTTSSVNFSSNKSRHSGTGWHRFTWKNGHWKREREFCRVCTVEYTCTVDVRLTCLINITYLLTVSTHFWIWGSGSHWMGNIGVVCGWLSADKR